MIMCSQFSTASTTSTIPYEEISHLVQDFVEELEVVNELYFGNVDHDSVDNFITEGDSTDSSDEDDDNENDVLENIQFEFDTEHDKEQTVQVAFKTNTCGCKRLYNGRPCSNVVNWDQLISYRLSCLEKTKDELDVLVKIQLFHHRNDGVLTSADSKSKHAAKDRVKVRQTYYFAGLVVCRNLFAFAHGLNRKTVDSIAKSLNTDFLEPRTHGNKGKVPPHAVNLQQTEAVKMFIVSYASQYGLTLPGRMARYRNEKNILLPSDSNKAEIYQLYCKAADDDNEKFCNRKVSLSTFKKIWLEQCPYILVMKPSTDLCLKCQKHVYKISHSANLSEEEKEVLLTDYQQHVTNVKSQRDDYRNICESSKLCFNDLEPEARMRGQAPCSNDVHLHYSFDYAQQVLYPHYAQQVGPLFFKTPRKCQCFGVCCEPSGSQIFYLVDEQYSAGKGANSVTSMLHHHFMYHGYGEKSVTLHMDNCSGQNKNNIVLGYGMWRVMSGLHNDITFSLMEAGHTKFSPDWHFGLWKIRWKHCDTESLDDIAKTVQQSSRKGHNIPQVVDDPEKPVVFSDWSSFIKKLFRPLPNLKRYHHFRMSSARPGIVFARQYAQDEEEEISILKKNVDVSGFPDRMQITGMDATRQWYLYDEIAPLCHNSDFACPMPDVAKPCKRIKLDKS